MLLRRHQAIATSLADLAEPANVDAFEIRTFGSPVHSTPLRLSDSDLQLLNQEIEDCNKVGIVRIGTGPWSSPDFMVSKPRSTKRREVIDYRRLNAQTIRDSYPQPHIDDVLRTVGQHSVFWKIDLKSGFW